MSSPVKPNSLSVTPYSPLPKKLQHDSKFTALHKNYTLRVSLLDFKMRELRFKYRMLKKQRNFYHGLAQKVKNIS
jgi:hypothetical protein